MSVASCVLCLSALAVLFPDPGRSWTVQLEEPTGIERRDQEVVQLQATFSLGEAPSDSLRVVDSHNRELPSQTVVTRRHRDGSVAVAEILFPATIMPGTQPRYTLLAAPSGGDDRQPGEEGGEYPSDIVLRRLGGSRLEIGNSRFSVIVDLGKEKGVPAIVEAYHRGTDPGRMLNLVETTPDPAEPLKLGVRSAGWGTALEGVSHSCGFTTVDAVESGPLRARVRLSGARIGSDSEEWQFEWCSGDPVLVWQARTTAPEGNYGYFFSAVSATPYEPFTHWVAGHEDWPQGWETDHPPHRTVSGQDLADLPGGHVVYYRPDQNYGSLGFVELDRLLQWSGIGAQQFYAVRPIRPRAAPVPVNLGTIERPNILEAAESWTSQIGLLFAEWKGPETTLAARSAYRRFAKPVLAHILESGGRFDPIHCSPAPRTPVYMVAQESASASADVEVAPRVCSLDGPWKLKEASKGQGQRDRYYSASLDDSGWRQVQVPGSVQTQLLTYPTYFSHEAEWISFKEWWYRKRFRVPADFKGSHIGLHFGATDYYADVWLNEKWLGRHEGYVDPYEYAVTEALDHSKENTLAVRVWTPVHYYWRHRPYTIKGSYGAVDQKPDDITALGITRSVRLLARGPRPYRRRHRPPRPQY